MIESIEKIKENGGRGVCPWWHSVKELKRKNNKIEFKTGLNIICGPNGSGKSTITASLAKLFHCYQGGVPKITKTSLDGIFESALFQEDYYYGDDFEVIHDGAPVFYFNPSNKVGICGSSLDDDFFNEGVASTFEKDSTGRTNIYGFNRILNAIGRCYESNDFNIECLLDGKCNSTWQQRIDVVNSFLKTPSEQPYVTLILDEPERSADLVGQLKFWELLKEDVCTKMQVIICTHNPLAMNVEGANYIYTQTTYPRKLSKYRKELKEIAK